MLILLLEAESRGGGLAAGLALEPDLELECHTTEPAALDRIGSHPFRAVVLDLPAANPDPAGLVRKIRERLGTTPLVVTTSDATVDRAVACMRAGATDFLPHPIDAAVLAARLRRAFGEPPIRETHGSPRSPAARRARDLILGEHPRLDAVRSFAERQARMQDAAILVTGEAGTGKRHLASAIHALSGSRARLVEVACASLDPARAEAELFGCEDRFPVAKQGVRRGLIEAAAGGTLYLDEVCSLPLSVQARLLAFLETRQLRRLGGTAGLPLSVRVVAATEEDPWQAVRAGRLRPDLLRRLAGATVHLPALRQMPAVAAQLAEHFAAASAAALGHQNALLDPAAAAGLAAYEWPGNLRELKQAVQHATAAADGGSLVIVPAQPGALPAASTGAVVMPAGLTLEEVERRYLLAALRDFQGDYTTLAARLGISRKTLWDKRRRLGFGLPGGERAGGQRPRGENGGNGHSASPPAVPGGGADMLRAPLREPEACCPEGN